MKQSDDKGYLSWKYDLLVNVQMLVFRHPETGINSNGVAVITDEELVGMYAHLKRRGDANQ